MCFFFKFIYFERERTSRGGSERERERQRIPSRLPTTSTELDAGLKVMNHEIMTGAEIESQTRN